LQLLKRVKALGLDDLIDIYQALTPEDYIEAVSWMERRVQAITEGHSPECIWFLEHTPCYTAGTSSTHDLATDLSHPVYQTGRGGQLTYHGPGQLVIYVLFNLKKRGMHIRAFLDFLETWQVKSLETLGISSFPRREAIGLWVRSGQEIRKIGSLGIRVKNGVTFHGASLNITCDLQPFQKISPCGLSGNIIGSLVQYDKEITLERVRAAFVSEVSRLCRVDEGER
jgi:lipoyl(octanoyl) transferase